MSIGVAGFNKNLACEPFVSRVPETKEFGSGEKKFKTHTSKETLVPLKVVYGLPDQDIFPNDLVYVKQDGVASQWSKEIDVELSDGTRRVVIVPVDKVVLVERTAERMS